MNAVDNLFEIYIKIDNSLINVWTQHKEKIQFDREHCIIMLQKIYAHFNKDNEMLVELGTDFKI